MVVRSPLGWEPVRPPERRPGLRLGVCLGFALVLVIAAFWIPLPYYSYSPGSAREVGTLIKAEGTQTYPPKGQLLLTTISLNQVRPFDALVGWIREDVDVFPEQAVLGPDTSRQEYGRMNVEVMDESKQNAIVVALRRLGYEVVEKGEGAFVQRVLPQFAAKGRLQEGDVIKAIDGKPVRLFQDAVAVISSHKPGELITIDVAQTDGSGAHQVQVPASGDPDQGGKTVLGVELKTLRRDFEMPFTVDIQSGSIGGPSAGLAFTLGVIDSLTPGELTGGRKVAVTGTIEIDGRVGDVGGVAQKTSAVKAAGADVFLVPAGEYDLARERAGKNLKVIKVTTLQEALDALGSLGGDLTALGPLAPG